MEIYIVRHGETLWNKERRCQGTIDISLSEYGRELAIETGKDNISLEVNEKNYAAISLYKKAGFEDVGRRKKYYNGMDDAIIMTKKFTM